MVNPICRKIFLMRFSVIVSGWRCPTCSVRPGRVTSICSEAIFSASARRESSSDFSVNSASSSARASLTILPMRGRSSSATALILRRSDVISPFFPRNFTRISLSSPRLLAVSAIAARARALSSLIFSSISSSCMRTKSYPLSVLTLSLIQKYQQSVYHIHLKKSIF